MADQTLSTKLVLDAVLDPGFAKAFDTGEKLLKDLNKAASGLEKDLKALGTSADHLDKIGDSSDGVRRDMVRLEKQIQETNRAADKFGSAKQHFRNASIGAKALGNDLKDVASFAVKAVAAVGAIGGGAAVALAPSEDVLNLDQTVAKIDTIAPEIDASDLDTLKKSIRDLSNDYGISADKIAETHLQLTRDLGFDAAQETITAALDFEVATGLPITELTDTLKTAKISMGIDTPAETKEFLNLLANMQKQGIDISNLDLGDMETVMARMGGDIFSETVQREIVTTVSFQQVDSFQLADYSQVFQEDLARAVTITPDMNLQDIEKAQQAIATLDKWGISAEKGLQGAMDVFMGLSKEQQDVFRVELDPVLGTQVVEIVERGSHAYKQVLKQTDAVFASTKSLADAAGEVQARWSTTWAKIANSAKLSLGIVQEQFASVFGESIFETVNKVYQFLSENQGQIQNFFTGIRDEVSPVIKNVWNNIKSALPDVKEFAQDVWKELKKDFEVIKPVISFVANGIWNITKAIAGFLTEHPRLVATVISGVVAWKAYKLASGAVQTTFDFLAGGVSLLQGHSHNFNATLIGNQRELAKTGNVALGTGRKFLDMGKNIIAMKFPRFTTVISGLGRIGTTALGALPGIGAMGAGLWGAIAPVLPVVLPVIAAVGVLAGLGFLVYQNWEPLKAFFVDNFETIRNVLTLVFPPIGILIGLAGVIRDNWQPIKDFFSTLWQTIKLSAQVAWEGIKFVGLGALTLIKGAWGGITGFFSDIWEGVKGVFTDSPLAPIFQPMIDGVKAVVSPLVSFFSDIWGNISKKVGEVLGSWTEKLEGFNKILDKLLGGFRKKNDEMAADLGLKSDVNVQSEVVNNDPITPEAKDFIKETYDFNLDDLGLDFAKPISQRLIAIEKMGQGAQTPKDLENVNNLRQDLIDKLTIALPGIEGKQEKQALEKVINTLQGQIQQKDTAAEMDFTSPQPFIKEIIGGESLLMPLGNILDENRKQTALLENIAPILPEAVNPVQSEVNINQDAPVMETPQATPYTPIAGSPAVQGSESSVVTNQTTHEGGAVSITNHFTINANSPEAADDIREIIEQVMQEQMEQYPERMLTQ